MQRITITIDDELLGSVDVLMAQKGYSSRSEALRDVLRQALGQRKISDPNTPCVATFGYIYDHATRNLANRLMTEYHHQHDLTVASVHIHLDHEACLEVSILRGNSGAVTALTDALASQRGVRHAQLHIVPVEISQTHHKHGDRSAPHEHLHA